MKPKTPQKHRRVSALSTGGRHSKTPIKHTPVKSKRVLKPVAVLRDLIRRAKDFSSSDFSLMGNNFTPKIIARVAHLCGSYGVKGDAVKSTSEAKPKLQKEKSEKKSKKEIYNGRHSKTPVKSTKYGSSPHPTPRPHPRIPPITLHRSLPSSSTSASPTPIFSIISPKPVDPALLQAMKAATDKKKFSLESLVNKLNLTKKEEEGSSLVPYSSTPSGSSTPLTADSSSNESLEGRTNKRKNSKPYKIISEAEAALLGDIKKKGGKRKKKGGKRVPPKRKKVEEENEEESSAMPIETATYEDDGLPPRIIVPGQEPGTELEWDEEEIIVLRAGEHPDQRPPRMKRKKSPEEIETDQTSPVKATSALETTLREEEQLLVAPIDLDAPQSSGTVAGGYGSSGESAETPTKKRPDAVETVSPSTPSCSSSSSARTIVASMSGECWLTSPPPPPDLPVLPSPPAATIWSQQSMAMSQPRPRPAMGPYRAPPQTSLTGAVSRAQPVMRQPQPLNGRVLRTPEFFGLRSTGATIRQIAEAAAHGLPTPIPAGLLPAATYSTTPTRRGYGSPSVAGYRNPSIGGHGLVHRPLPNRTPVKVTQRVFDDMPSTSSGVIRRGPMVVEKKAGVDRRVEQLLKGVEQQMGNNMKKEIHQSQPAADGRKSVTWKKSIPPPDTPTNRMMKPNGAH